MLFGLVFREKYTACQLHYNESKKLGKGMAINEYGSLYDFDLTNIQSSPGNGSMYDAVGPGKEASETNNAHIRLSSHRNKLDDQPVVPEPEVTVEENSYAVLYDTEKCHSSKYPNPTILAPSSPSHTKTAVSVKTSSNKVIIVQEELSSQEQYRKDDEGQEAPELKRSMESIRINSKVSTQQQKSLKQKENVHRPSATSQNQIQENGCRQNPVVSIQPSYMSQNQSHLPSICSQQGYLTPNPQPSMQSNKQMILPRSLNRLCNLAGFAIWRKEGLISFKTRNTPDPLFRFTVNQLAVMADKKTRHLRRTNFEITPDMLTPLLDSSGYKESCFSYPMKYVCERSTDADDGRAFEEAGILPNVQREDLPVERTTHEDDKIIIKSNLISSRPRKIYTKNECLSINTIREDITNVYVRIADHKQHEDIEFGVAFLHADPPLTKILHTCSADVKPVIKKWVNPTVVTISQRAPICLKYMVKEMTTWNMTICQPQAFMAHDSRFVAESFPGPLHIETIVPYQNPGKVDRVRPKRTRAKLIQWALTRSTRYKLK